MRMLLRPAPMSTPPRNPSATYELENIISVAATDHDDLLASFSSHGKGVDLAAPGVDILSTIGNAI